MLFPFCSQGVLRVVQILEIVNKISIEILDFPSSTGIRHNTFLVADVISLPGA